MKERRLIIMRHAKSSWSSNAKSDHDRPLNNRGRRDAPLMAGVLLELNWVPDAVFGSDSRRTRETWSLMEETLKMVKEITFDRKLYHGDLENVQQIVKVARPKSKTILVLGHNPGCQEMLERLTGCAEKFTTSNCALLSHEWGKWNDVLGDKTNWKLRKMLRPKELKKL